MDPLARRAPGRFLRPALLLCLSCATPQTDALLEPPELRPSRADLIAVPHHPHQEKQCGPAALAMVLNASGVAVTPEELAPHVMSPEKGGSLQLSIVAAARRHGRLAYPVSDLETLLSEVGAGQPVLVLQNLGLRWLPFWHYAVVVGYDLERGAILLHSGKQARRVLDLRVFERTWTRAGSWGLLVVEPGYLPVSAEETRFVSAAAGLESAGHAEAALHAYRTALARWPGSLAGWIGLGNSLHALGDLEGAESAFRRATHLHPESAASFNNLAHVLAEQGRGSEALAAARRAVQLSDGQESLYAETLKEIEREAGSAGFELPPESTP